MTTTPASAQHRPPPGTTRVGPGPARPETHSQAGAATDTTDHVHLATPQAAAQAALHPILEPAVQFALVTGFMLAASNAQGSAIPLVTVDAALKAMDHERALTYTIDLKNEDTPVATGTYGETATDRLVAQSSGPMVYEGPDDTRLVITEDKRTKAIHLDGKLQGLVTNLSVKANPPAHPGDDLQGFHTEGHVGGQGYTMDSNFAITPGTEHKQSTDVTADDIMDMVQGKPPTEEESKPETGTMVAHGSVAGQTIHKSYKFTETDESFGATIQLDGTGTVAGVSQDARVVLTLVA